MRPLPFHLGPNAWDDTGRLYAVGYPDTLMVADSGQPEDLSIRHVFADAPDDVRGLFVAADGSLFVGLKGFKHGSFGRTMRSTDGGRSFIEVLDRCFWGMDQDKSGRLFIGCYHERGEPKQECAIYMSADGGARWDDVSSPVWKNQTHVHGLAICPERGWLYAALGDQDGLDGCWRMRNRTLKVLAAATADSLQLHLSTTELEVSQGTPALLWDERGSERVEIAHVTGGIVHFAAPLARDYSAFAHLEILDWVNKFCSAKADAQYVGIAFKDGWVYLSDDNPRKKNPPNAVVYRARDDGSDVPQAPVPVLVNDVDNAWGAFFLKRDASGTLWTAVRPFQGKGRLWRSHNGIDWQTILETAEEPLEAWRISHTLRDMTYGSNGGGHCLFSPRGTALVSVAGTAVETASVGRTDTWLSQLFQRVSSRKRH